MTYWARLLAQVLVVGVVAQLLGFWLWAVVGTEVLGWVLAPGLAMLRPDGDRARLALAASLDTLYYGLPLVWWWRRRSTARTGRNASRPAV